MDDLCNVTATILAGGPGIRLRPAVSDRPKVLAEVNGRPFMAYLLDQLLHAGIQYAVVCTGYLGEQVRETFGEGYGRLHLAYSQESKPLGTAGALRLALPLIKSNPVLVMNGDSFFDVNLGAFWIWHRRKKSIASILLRKMDKTGRYGRVEVDHEGLVVCFEEKKEAGPGWMNGGIYLIQGHLLREIPKEATLSLEQDLFPLWVGRGLCGFCSEGRFLDIGIPEAYRMADDFFNLGD